MVAQVKVLIVCKSFEEVGPHRADGKVSVFEWFGGIIKLNVPPFIQYLFAFVLLNIEPRAEENLKCIDVSVIKAF